MANFYLAFEANLHLIPVLNKIDLTSADPQKVAAELVDIGFDESELLKVIPRFFCFESSFFILTSLTGRPQPRQAKGYPRYSRPL